MTTLAITANYEKKRLKCFGTVAAGEHVAVTVTNGAQWIGEGKALRLRILFGPDTVGAFPFADGDAWTAAGQGDADATCELNLNTLQAAKYLKCGGTCLWILDDIENHTLYATGEFDVLPWTKRRGIDEPIDLDGYPLLLDEINGLREDFEAYQQTVSQMLATKQDTIFDLASIRSGAAAGATAVQPDQIARFVDGAEYRQSYGEQNNPAILFKHGTNVIVALDATPFVKDGMVSSVEVVGGNLVITFNTESGKQPISIPLTAIFDPENYYDKTAADGKFVAKADVASTVTKEGANPVKSSGIWSAIWGAPSALPTGFSSLYDWCVSQLAGKVPTSRTVNGKALSSDVTLSASDVGALGNTGDQTLNGNTLLIDNNGPDTELNLTGIQGDVRIENWGGEYRGFASQQNPDARWRWPGVASPEALARLYDVMRFSEKRVYTNGEIVFCNGGMYRCVITLHSGAWDDSAFELVLGGLSTGTPTAPTPTAGDNSTKVATTAFVQGAVGSIKTFQHDAGGYYIEVEAS